MHQHNLTAAYGILIPPPWSNFQGCWRAHFLKLPTSVLTKILRHVLIPRLFRPLVLPILQVNLATDKAIINALPVLQTCQLLRNVGRDIFYCENTFTTASPSLSYEFDNALYRLCGWQRQLVTSISLQIDWADELWTKFPLVVVALCELKKLQRLEIFFVQKVLGGSGRPVGDELDAGEEMHEARRREARGWKREGKAAEVMLKAEKKVFRDLVCSVKGLRVFRLVGFTDEEFARDLESRVGTGGAPRGWINPEHWEAPGKRHRAAMVG